MVGDVVGDVVGAGLPLLEGQVPLQAGAQWAALSLRLLVEETPLCICHPWGVAEGLVCMAAAGTTTHHLTTVQLNHQNISAVYLIVS